MSKENKAVVRQVLDRVWSQGDLDAIDELFAEDVIANIAGQPEPVRGRDTFKEFVGMFRGAFPDMRVTVEEQIAEGDLVTTRWTARATHEGDFMGTPATGRQATISGIQINRIAGGRIVEGWVNFDALGLMQQIGAVPTPTRA